jgi:hypothetical protein
VEYGGDADPSFAILVNGNLSKLASLENFQHANCFMLISLIAGTVVISKLKELQTVIAFPAASDIFWISLS